MKKNKTINLIKKLFNIVLGFFFCYLSIKLEPVVSNQFMFLVPMVMSVFYTGQAIVGFIAIYYDLEVW